MRLRELVLLAVIAVLAAIGVLLDAEAFLRADNLLRLLREHTELSLLVLAQAILLIGGRVDLSLESTAGLAPALAVALAIPAAANGLGTGLAGWLVIPLCLLFGSAIGVGNGLLVLRFRVSALAATLGTLLLVRGVHAGFMGGRDLFEVPGPVAYLGSAHWLGVPASIWLCALAFAAGMAFLGYFRHGRALYAIGGDRRIAMAAGIRADRVLWIVFIAAGLLSALAGLLMAGRVGSISASHGQGMIFTVLAAAVVGGLSLKGGKGTLFAALCGVLVLALVGNVIILAGADGHWVPALHGIVAIAALLLTHLRARRLRP